MCRRAPQQRLAVTPGELNDDEEQRSAASMVREVR
jgi:hypothetical protein